MSRTRIYLAGAGVIARAHAEAVALLPVETEIHAADPSPASRAQFAEKFPAAQLYESVEAMLATPAEESDIVVVATPPFLHVPQVRLAIESGRHVLSEKPLGVAIEPVEELFALAEERNRQIACCSCRFLGIPSTELAKSLVTSGRLGEVQTVTWQVVTPRSRSGIEYQPASRWFIDRNLSGGGSLNDWGVYDFATICDVLRPTAATILQAWTGRTHTAIDPTDVPYTVEDRALASIRFETPGGAVLVSYERASCIHSPGRAVTEIHGTEGGITWDWLAWDGNATLNRFHDHQGKSACEETKLPPAEIAHCHHRPLIYFWRALNGQPHHALIGKEALRNFRIVRAMYSVAESGTPMRLDFQ